MVKLSKPSESVTVTILRPAGALPVSLLQSTRSRFSNLLAAKAEVHVSRALSCPSPPRSTIFECLPSRYLLPNLTGVFVLIQTRTNKGRKWEVRATPSRTARIVAQQRDSAVSPYPMSFSAAASSVAPSRAIETNRWIASAQDRCTTNSHFCYCRQPISPT
jgi:hypothetical protein